MKVTDKELYLSLADKHTLVPVSRRVPADTETPVSTYLKTARGPWSFLLESVEGGTQWGRYSIVGFDPFLTVRCTRRFHSSRLFFISAHSSSSDLASPP